MLKTFSCGLFYFSFFLFFLTVLPGVYAGQNTPVKKENHPDKLIAISTEDSIQIEMRNATLHEALNAVIIKSKIDFEVPESLLNDKITFSSNSRDWSEAIKKMLKQYNVAYGWEKNRLNKVFIFERGTGKVLQLIPAPLDDLPASSDLTETNQNVIDTAEYDHIFQSMPSFPTEEEKIIEMKFGSQRSIVREKKPDMGMDDLLIGAPLESPPEFPEESAEKYIDFSELGNPGEEKVN